VAVHLRLTRAGRHKRPFYRVVAADSRKPRDGRYLEVLGTYDALKNPPVAELKQERVHYWLSQGAQRFRDKGLRVASFSGPLLEKTLLEDPLLLKTPIVRNGKEATVGYAPEIWTAWLA